MWRPVAGDCVRRDEGAEKQRGGFKAWQRLPGFSTTAIRCLGLFVFYSWNTAKARGKGEGGGVVDVVLRCVLIYR